MKIEMEVKAFGEVEVQGAKDAFKKHWMILKNGSINR